MLGLDKGGDVKGPVHKRLQLIRAQLLNPIKFPRPAPFHDSKASQNSNFPEGSTGMNEVTVAFHGSKMGPLSNPRHERFAQPLAQGKTATEAYILAGYKANAGNATRMKGNERISARVQEIVGRAAER